MIALRFLVLTVGVAIGVIMPFGPVILASLGFGSGAIGFIVSLGAIGITLAIPAWGHLADVRLGRPRTLQVCGAGAAVAALALLGPWPAVVLAFLFIVFWVFESAWQQTADAITVNSLTGRGREYGRVRLLTSLSFAIGTTVAGFIYQQTGYAWAFVIAAAAALVMAASSFGIPDIPRADLAAHARSSDDGSSATSSRPRAWRLGSAGVALRVAPRLGPILVAIGLVHVGVISGNTFLGLRLIELGGGPSDVALSAGLSAMAEIPSMIVVGWVASRVGLRGLFAISAVLYAVCLAGWVVLDSPTLIIASRVLTGVAYASMTVGVVLTMAAILPPELQATGQGPLPDHGVRCDRGRRERPGRTLVQHRGVRRRLRARCDQRGRRLRRRLVRVPSPPGTSGDGGGRCDNGLTMTIKTGSPADKAVVTRGGGAPNSWGLGDGQAIPWEYAPAPESRDVVHLQERYGLFIGGKNVAASDGAVFTTVDPSTELPLADVARGTAEDMDRAVRAARTAFRRRWGDLPGRERAKYLFRIARILQERSREFAVLESMDSGKPIKESRDVDVPLAAAHFWYYAGWADKLEYAFPGRVARPLGVAGQIIPWNFPLLMLAWKIAPALAAGNTVVLKPASTTPLTALLFADVCRQADLPPGVVNIVPGPGEVGMSLVRHPGVDKIAFTGSTDIGRRIAAGIAGSDKALTLELGGKAANIVFDDAPLDQAVEGIVNGIYFNQGEVCCAGSRLLVQESIVEPLIDKLKDRLSTIRVGDPLDKNTDVGAINSRAQLEKITELVAAGVAEGAELYQPPCDLPERGYFFRPTLFTNVAQSHRIAREEIFGPVLSVLTFRTPDEAIEKANNTPYGLSAGVWTDKGSRILAMVKRLKAGVVWANTFNRFDPTSPFGGYKESGYGREGGRHGLHAYVRLEDR